MTSAIPAWKRILDIGVILLTLPLWGPIMLLITVGIKLISRGPVLYKHERVGYHERRFVCLKFRSMRLNTETASHQDHFEQLVRSEVPMTKLDELGDRRLIPLGALLRATGLDELPQLLNILRGDMSLVGPRPCTPHEYERCYQPCHKGRFNTLPGLTGLWQVSGKNQTTFSEMIDLDILYASRLSLWADLRIILKTFPVLIAQTMRLVQNRLSREHSLEESLDQSKS